MRAALYGLLHLRVRRATAADREAMARRGWGFAPGSPCLPPRLWTVKLPSGEIREAGRLDTILRSLWWEVRS